MTEQFQLAIEPEAPRETCRTCLYCYRSENGFSHKITIRCKLNRAGRKHNAGVTRMKAPACGHWQPTQGK